MGKKDKKIKIKEKKKIAFTSQEAFSKVKKISN
jgi:hypothetical protein